MRTYCCQPELFMRKWQTNKHTKDTTFPLNLRKISYMLHKSDTENDKICYINQKLLTNVAIKI